MSSWPVAVFHFCALVESICSVQVYDFYSRKLNRPYGEDWRYLTYINLHVKLLCFALCILEDLLEVFEMRQVMKFIRKPKQVFYTTIGLPSSIIVFLMFWGLYALDRELVHPSSLDDVIPSWANHMWHTAVLLTLLEVATTHHIFLERRKGLAIVSCWLLTYLAWILWIYNQTGSWAYPFFEAFDTMSFILFVLSQLALSWSIYVFGEFLNSATDTLFFEDAARVKRTSKRD